MAYHPIGKINIPWTVLFTGQENIYLQQANRSISMSQYVNQLNITILLWVWDILTLATK